MLREPYTDWTYVPALEESGPGGFLSSSAAFSAGSTLTAAAAELLLKEA